MSPCGFYGSCPPIHISNSFPFLIFQTFLTAAWQPQPMSYCHVVLNTFIMSSTFSFRAGSLPDLMRSYQLMSCHLTCQLLDFCGVPCFFWSLLLCLCAFVTSLSLMTSWSLNPPCYCFVWVLSLLFSFCIL